MFLGGVIVGCFIGAAIATIVLSAIMVNSFNTERNQYETDFRKL